MRPRCKRALPQAPASGLAVHRPLANPPLARYLFWSDRGSVPNIARSDLNGENRINLIITKLVWPNGTFINDFPCNFSEP